MLSQIQESHTLEHHTACPEYDSPTGLSLEVIWCDPATTKTASIIIVLYPSIILIVACLCICSKVSPTLAYLKDMLTHTRTHTFYNVCYQLYSLYVSHLKANTTLDNNKAADQI
ncbi:hypothetical protein J6590_044015 [Homalodisca vitripennis]|nr:hypothetical protein J6590_044015 [Homalodisca vitripennis]